MSQNNYQIPLLLVFFTVYVYAVFFGVSMMTTWVHLAVTLLCDVVTL